MGGRDSQPQCTPHTGQGTTYILSSFGGCPLFLKSECIVAIRKRCLGPQVSFIERCIVLYQLWPLSGGLTICIGDLLYTGGCSQH